MINGESTSREINGKKVQKYEFRIVRVRDDIKQYIAIYVFENPKTIADIIEFMNSKSENKILGGYLEKLEERARAQCEEALGERRVF